MVNDSRQRLPSCQLGYRKTISTRRRTCSIQRPSGCARRAQRTPTSTWTVPDLAAVGVGLRRPAACDQAGRAGAVSAPAITKMVSALESAGLAAGAPETDRRVVLVSATPDGKRLLERGREQGASDRRPA